MSKKIFITCALPYINAEPHLGHIFEFIQGDCFARFNKIIGNQVYFTSGTDENSLKNIIASKKNNASIQEWIDTKTNSFLKLKDDFNICFDDFIRTTEKRHHLGAQKLWNSLNKEDIIKKNYEGLYCIDCETFYTEDELVNGLCPEHKKPLEKISEENYFFVLKNYANFLIEKIQNNEWNIMPESRKNEVLSFLKGDIYDISITRSKKRSEGLGIKIPEDDNQVLWVWIDALSNYINVLDYAEDNDLFKKWWKESDERWHFLGKGVLRFHAIFWPAFLASANIPLPTHLFCHGYVNINGEKMSKSLGNSVDPRDLLKKYSLDSIRYYLMKDIPSGDDGDFNEHNLAMRHNNELCASYGNLVSRVFALGEKYGKNIKLTPNDLKNDIDNAITNYIDNFSKVRINDAINCSFELIGKINKYISDNQPWKLIESSPEEFEKVIVSSTVGIIYATMLLLPIMPDTCEKIFKYINLDVGTLKDLDIIPTVEINFKKPENLFNKIDE
jgi:methionyl-tRNA synthetase